MKIYLFVAEDGEAAQRLVCDAKSRGLAVQLHIGDNQQSNHLRQTYDVTTRPAVLVTLDDGSYVRLWQGILPTIAELNYVATS